MSFMRNINGNNNNCTEKVCIQAKKVFDACLKQLTMENATLALTNANPPNPVAPLQFISAKSTSSTGVVSNLVVERLPDRPHFGRVQCDVAIPVEVTYVDNNGVEGAGSGNLIVHEDVVMYLPDAAIIPYEVEASVSAVCPDGFFVGLSPIIPDPVLEFSVVACLTVILKITIQVELIVPTYGYAVIPPCQDYSQEVCDSFFDLPLFPRTNA